MLPHKYGDAFPGSVGRKKKHKKNSPSLLCDAPARVAFYVAARNGCEITVCVDHRVNMYFMFSKMRAINGTEDHISII